MLNNTTATSIPQFPNVDDVTFIMTCTRLIGRGMKSKTVHLSTSFIIMARIVACINFAVVIPTVVANLSIIIAMFKTKTAHTISNMIIMSVVFVSLVQGCFSFPFYGSIIMSVTYRKHDCISTVICGYVGGSLAVVSMLTVILLSYERYIAIIKTYSYLSKFSPTRIKVAVALIWVASFTLFFFVIFVPAVLVYSVGIVSLITISTYVFNAIVHVKINRVIRKMRRDQVSTVFGRANSAAHEYSKERRTTKFTAYAICFLLICYLPTLVKQFFISTMRAPSMLNYMCDTILCLHATFSPILYSWQSPAIGRAVRQLWKFRPASSVGQSDAQPAVTRRTDKTNNHSNTNQAGAAQQQ